MILNCELNHLNPFPITIKNIINSEAGNWDLIVLGDMFYDEQLADGLHHWLQKCIRIHQTEVLIGDPGRHQFLSHSIHSQLHKVIEYSLPESTRQENYGLTSSIVWSYQPSDSLHDSWSCLSMGFCLTWLAFCRYMTWKWELNREHYLLKKSSLLYLQWTDFNHTHWDFCSIWCKSYMQTVFKGSCTEVQIYRQLTCRSLHAWCFLCVFVSCWLYCEMFWMSSILLWGEGCSWRTTALLLQASTAYL